MYLLLVKMGQSRPAQSVRHRRHEVSGTGAIVEQSFPVGESVAYVEQIESAKETVLEIIGRPLYDQLRVEAMWGYALCGGNTTVMKRSQQFFDNADRGRAGATATPL